jgi:protein-S-isoprenylcysteine O-methyltransferase Ste14
MTPLLPPLYLSFLATQLYALNLHFPHPTSGLVYPASIQLLKLFSFIAGLLSWTPILSSPSSSTTSTPTKTTPTLATAISVPLLLSSLLLFTWTALTTRPRTFSVIFGRVTPRYVVDTGPFAWVRHPTYVSYALGWLGTVLYVLIAYVPDYLSSGIDVDAPWVALPARSAGLVGTMVGLMWLYRRGAVLEEEQFLKDQGTVSGEKTDEGVRVEYLAYMRRVKSRWIPGFA